MLKKINLEVIIENLKELNPYDSDSVFKCLFIKFIQAHKTELLVELIKDNDFTQEFYDFSTREVFEVDLERMIITFITMFINKFPDSENYGMDEDIYKELLEMSISDNLNFVINLNKFQMDNATRPQKLLVSMIRSFKTEVFLEMIYLFDLEEYYETFDYENATDDECFEALFLLTDTISQWNKA